MKVVLAVSTFVFLCLLFVSFTIQLVHLKVGVNLFVKYDSKQFRNNYLHKLPNIFPDPLPSKTHLMGSNVTMHLPIKDSVVVLEEPDWASRMAGQEIFATFFILSAPNHRSQRDGIRRQFRDLLNTLQKTHLSNLLLTITFLLGKTSDFNLTEELKEEHDMFKDFLWIDVEDSYRNLSCKTLSFLNWVVSKQQLMEKDPSSGFRTDWIVKMDDDIPILVDRLILDLSGIHYPKEVVLCNAVLKNVVPVRDRNSVQKKVYVSSSEWPDNVLYPDMCMGWLYITTPQVAERLLKATLTAPYLSQDDLYITGILREEAEDVSLMQMDWTNGLGLFKCSMFSALRGIFVLNYFNIPTFDRLYFGFQTVYCFLEQKLFGEPWLCNPY